MSLANADTVTLAAAPRDAIEADLAGALLWNTDPHIFGFLHGHDETLGFGHLGHQWQLDAGLFSHRHARAALDASGRLVGLQLGFDRATQEAEVGPFAAAAQDFLNEAQFAQFVRWFEYGAFVLPPIPDDAWYLQNLAIIPEARGRGIGERLLQDCFEQARSAGCGRVHLDLYAGNPAQRLYERAGMRTIVETRVAPLVDEGVDLHLRMELRL